MEGTAKPLDLITLEERMRKKMEDNRIKIEERMGHIENMVWHMEDNIAERIVKLLQHQEEKVPKEDDVVQGVDDDKNSANVEQTSINKHGLRGIDSNIGCNKSWSIKGIQLPNIDMKKFYGKDPIMRIFQIEQFFDIHRVPNL